MHPNMPAIAAATGQLSFVKVLATPGNLNCTPGKHSGELVVDALIPG
jgi:hypothetical protein